jgi:hypothetical protein
MHSDDMEELHWIRASKYPSQAIIFDRDFVTMVKEHFHLLLRVLLVIVMMLPH